MSAMQGAFLTYARVAPSDLHLCWFHLSTATWHAFRDESIAVYGDRGGREEPGPDDTLFGRPIRIDDTLPLGTVEAWQKVA